MTFYSLTMRFALIPARTTKVFTALSECLNNHQLHDITNHTAPMPLTTHAQMIPWMSIPKSSGWCSSSGEGPGAVELLTVDSHGTMIRQGFFHKWGFGGVVSRTNDASLWPTRFHAFILQVDTQNRHQRKLTVRENGYFQGGFSNFASISTLFSKSTNLDANLETKSLEGLHSLIKYNNRTTVIHIYNGHPRQKPQTVGE